MILSLSAFTEKKQRPTEEAARSAIGDLLPWWDALVTHIRHTYACQEDWAFLYGRSYGWGLRFRSRRVLLTNLFPGAGGLTVQINLSPEGVEQARSLATGPGVGLAVERAHPYPEGRWLYIPVTSEADLQDVQALLELRAREKRIERHPS